MLKLENRFKGNRQIMTIIKKGQSVYGQSAKLKYLKNENQRNSKFSVIVSKKVSKKAVIRNRIRRRIYNNLKLNHLSNRGMFALFIYSDKFFYIKNLELTTIINELFNKAG